jgi:Na+/H+ antiporter NhaD/arsenite permease-like protein
MNKTGRFVSSLVLALLAAMPAGAVDSPPASDAPDLLIVAGTVSNAHGKAVNDVEVEIYVDGQKLESELPATTSSAGRFVTKFRLPAGTMTHAKVEIEAHRPSYASAERQPISWMMGGTKDPGGRAVYLAHHALVLERAVTPAFWIATAVLIAVYALIAFEWMHRTLAALLGAAGLLFLSYTAGRFNSDFRILSFEDAIGAIDMNVILLLMAMMIIVGVLKRTGVFQWMAYKSFQLARGNIFALSAILVLVTAVTSAFLDNVTTMLLIIPVTIEIAMTLKIDPITLLMPEVFASNVGGTATLIGDPPNIMIGSYARLSFLDFAQHLTLVCLICLAVTAVYFLYWYKKDYLKAEVGDVQALIARLRDEYRITDRALLIKGGVILGITVFLFIIHGFLHMEPSIAALLGATLLLVVSKVDIVEMLEHEIEWPTLIFFMALFMVVAGAEETGLIQAIAGWVNNVSQGSLVVAILMILWVSALASAIIDNIPFTATMLPIVAFLSTSIPGAESGVLWWALALGACLGGNGTMVGASANVVTVGMAEKAGHFISFGHYFKVAAIPTLITIVICSFWLVLVMR